MTANPDFIRWTDDFVSAQQGYWDLWSRLAQQSLRADPAAAQMAMGGWADTFDRWWKGMQASMPKGELAPALGPMADQMRWFMQMSEGGTRSFSAFSGMNQPAEQWQQHLERSFEQFRQFLTPGQVGDWADAARSLMSLGPEPVGSVMQSMAGLCAASADILNGLKGEWPALMGPLENETQRLLGIPAIGYNRESQEKMQHALQLHLAHQHAVNRFSVAMSGLTSESMDRMLQKLIAMGEKGEKVTTLRGLYDLWVDSSEEVFARYAMTDEFARLYGEVVNTLMAFRLHAQKMVDDALSQMNLPTRRELDTQHERFQALRRKVADLDLRVSGSSVTPAVASAAERRIAVLEEQVARLSAQLDAPPSTRPIEPATGSEFGIGAPKAAPTPEDPPRAGGAGAGARKRGKG